MASIQKRGKDSFLLVVELGYDGRGKRIRRTRTIRVKDEKLLRTKKRLNDHLQKELYKFKIEIETGEYIQTENLKYSQFVEDWTEKHAKKNLALRTQQNYKEKLNNYIIPYFGNLLLNDIKTIHIVKFLDTLSQPGQAHSGRKEELSSATLYEIDKTLRVVFNKAVEWNVLKESPMANLKRPTIPKSKRTIYEEKDIYQFIGAIYQEDIVWRMFFLTSAISGMRRGEVVALQWSDFNFEDSCILLKRSIPTFVDGSPLIKSTKSDEDVRPLYMPDWYMDEMLEFKKFWESEKYAAGNKWIGGEGKYLFHNGFGKPYTPNAANAAWNRIKKDHGLKDIRLHDLRHTMITYLLGAGESVFNVSKRAGHSSSKVTTEIYGHATKSSGQATAKHFEKFNPASLVNKRSTEPVFVDKVKK